MAVAETLYPSQDINPPTREGCEPNENIDDGNPFLIIGDLQTDGMSPTAGLGAYRLDAGEFASTTLNFPDFSDGQLQTYPPLPVDHTPASVPATNDALSISGCKCLSSLYSTLSSFQTLLPPSFPYSMNILTKATTVACDALRCQRCPFAYASALQNLMSLCTLLPLIAHEYGKLLKHIDERSSKGHPIAFRMGEHSMDQLHLHTGTLDCPMSFEAELSAVEWRSMARRAIKQRVIGGAGLGISVLGLLGELESRQRDWHAKPRLAEFQHGLSCMEDSCSVEEKHTCLQMVFRARRAIKGLDLEEDSSS
ncbi:MAG: hypothetical protein Q9195_003285 [Heterodermia aff. obscurata]